jgi:UrcA family protein
MNRITPIAILLTFASLVTTAHAEDQNRTESQFTVPIGHTNFANASQVKALYTKLHIFAKMACESDVSDPLTANADKQCEAMAVSEAVHQIDRVELSRLDDASSVPLRRPAIVLTRNDH